MVLVVANVILVCINIVGVVIAIFTLRKLERQTRGTEIAARATLQYAQSLVNAERPWLVITIERDKEFERLFQIRVVNRGRTPASIISARDGFLAARGKDELPVRPEYSRGGAHKAPILLVQGESQLICEWSRDHLKYGLDDADCFAAIERREQFAYVFGEVLYKNLLLENEENGTRIHRTRWCCAFFPRSLEQPDRQDEFALVSGPDDYTCHT